MSAVSPMNFRSGAISFRAVDLARKAIDRAMAVDRSVLSSVFTRFDADRIAAQAHALDNDDTRKKGALAGLTVSIKDLFDEADVTTTAGSVVLADNAPARQDAEVVRRLKAAGAMACGRTSMTEFAYSGVGLNPHYGNPGNALDPLRISGGSSSGAALSITLGIADAALGSDTGGSVRIPAALNGLAGFKPSQSAVPLEGSFPLSPTYDSIGPLARTIGQCAALHAVLSGSQPVPANIGRPRVGVVRGLLVDGIDAAVGKDFERALTRLESDSMDLEDVDAGFLEGHGDVNRIIVAVEAYDVHREHLDRLEVDGDPRVLRRIRAAEGFASSEDGARRQRAEAIRRFGELAQTFDVLVAPTVPVVAPLIAETEDDFDRVNALMLRNPSAVNFLDGCSATVPMNEPGRLTTGLMLFAPGGRDWTVLDIAGRAELALRP